LPQFAAKHRKRPTRIDHIIDQEDRGRANLPGIDFKDIFQVRQLSEPILFLQDLWLCEDLCRSLAERSGSANLCRRSTTIASFLLILELVDPEKVLLRHIEVE
jgi:hypothetical protein